MIRQESVNLLCVLLETDSGAEKSTSGRAMSVSIGTRQTPGASNPGPAHVG